MPYNYLDAFNSLITKSQRIELANIIDTKIKAGEIDSESFGPALEEAIAKIDPNNKPLVKLRLVESTQDKPTKISSSDYNDLIEETHIDLVTLFNESNLTADVISRHEQISKDFIKSLQRQLLGLSARVDAYQAAALNTKGYSAFVEETFTKSVGTLSAVEIEDGGLRLAKVPGYPIVYNSGPIINEITVDRYPEENVYSGINYATTPDHDVEANYNNTLSKKTLRSRKEFPRTRNMLRSGTTYGVWAEVALTDSPVFHNIDGQNFFGIVAILTIKYNGTYDINTITVDPYSDFDMYIPRVRYRTTDDEWHLVTVLDNNRSAPLSGGGSDVIRLEGFDILKQVKELELLLFQPSSTIQRFILNKNQLQDVELWDELLEREYEKYQYDYHSESDTITSAHMDDPRLTDKAIEGTILDRHVVKLQSANSIAEMLKNTQEALNLSPDQVDTLAQSVVGNYDTTFQDSVNSPELTEFRKHEYIYGAYSISPQNIKYTSASGIFRSPVYDTKENIITEVGLDITESLPSGTSIAYSIIDAEQRMKTPILPSNTNSIYEQIHNASIDASGDRTLEWETRFPATSGTVKLYVDLEEPSTDAGAYPITYYQTDNISTGTRVLVEGPSLEPTIPYTLTCEYIPELNKNYLGTYQSNHESINILHSLTPIMTTESTSEELTIDNYQIKLKHYPFIHYSRFDYTDGSAIGRSQLVSGGDFLYGDFPFKTIYGDWLYQTIEWIVFPFSLRTEDFINEIPIAEPNTFWNVTYIKQTESNGKSFCGKVESYVLNPAAIKLLRFENINPAYKYAITKIEQDTTHRRLYIGVYVPPDFGPPLYPGWAPFIKFEWEIGTGTWPDSVPERDTTYEQTVNTITGGAIGPALGLTDLVCRIRLDWGELFRPVFPMELPEPESYNDIAWGEGEGFRRLHVPVFGDVYLNRLHPMSGHLDHPHMLPIGYITGDDEYGNHNAADPYELYSTYGMWVTNEEDFSSGEAPPITSGTLQLPATNYDFAPDFLSTCEIMPEVVNDAIWQELEYYGWTEQIDVSGWMQRDEFKNIFRPIQLFVDKTAATDKTAYKRNEQQEGLDLYTLANEYQFYLYHDSLYTNFDFSLDPTKTVEVKYGYLTDGLQLHAELHSNRTGPSDLTPVLKDYRLKFRSRQ